MPGRIFPIPESPVRTTSSFLGIFREIFFKLCSLAPRIFIYCFGIVSLLFAMSAFALSFSQSSGTIRFPWIPVTVPCYGQYTTIPFYMQTFVRFIFYHFSSAQTVSIGIIHLSFPQKRERPLAAARRGLSLWVSMKFYIISFSSFLYPFLPGNFYIISTVLILRDLIFHAIPRLSTVPLVFTLPDSLTTYVFPSTVTFSYFIPSSALTRRPFS